MDRNRPNKKMNVALGLMSGTSMDGIDIAVLRTNGKYRVEHGSFMSVPYTDKFRARLDAGLETARKITSREERLGDLEGLERDLTKRHIKAIEKFLKKTGLRLSDVDVIGFHGHTILHRPDEGLTVQIGSAQTLADETGIPVVYDLRANDMAHGGQGAPLACAYHRALAREAGVEKWPVAFANIGGISNLTWISEDGRLLAMDAGPGNMLIDQWMADMAGKAYDEGGKTASGGKVIGKIVKGYLASPFFDRPPPKSLDRKDFIPLGKSDASLADGARTLARLTAAALARACEHLPQPPAIWIVSGGGAHNPVILADLAELAPKPEDGGEARVTTAAEFGLNGDAVEAEAWAYLAVRSLRGLKITWPGTTGVREAAEGGVIAWPSRHD